jgi:hypothetical protein
MKRTLTISALVALALAVFAMSTLPAEAGRARSGRLFGAFPDERRIASLHQDAFATAADSDAHANSASDTNSDSDAHANSATDTNSESEPKPESEPNSESVAKPEPGPEPEPTFRLGNGPLDFEVLFPFLDRQPRIPLEHRRGGLFIFDLCPHCEGVGAAVVV